MKTYSLIVLALSVLLLPKLSQAGTLAAAAVRIQADLGIQKAQTATLTCDMTNMLGSNSNGPISGNVGVINTILCFAKNSGLTGPTGAAGKTTTATVSGQTVSVHTVINSPGPTINGVAYAYEMKIWMCGTGCTATTGFLNSLYIAYNADSTGATNNGIVVNWNSASSGTIDGTVFAKWDTGSATTTKTINAMVVNCSNTTATLLQYSKTGNVINLADVVGQSNAVTRTAVTYDVSANTGNWYQDTTLGAGGDTPGAWSGGFTRVASGTDYTYSAATAGTTAVPTFPTFSGATLSGSTYAGATCSATTGVSLVTVGTGVISPVLTSATLMTVNPPNI